MTPVANSLDSAPKMNMSTSDNKRRVEADEAEPAAPPRAPRRRARNEAKSLANCSKAVYYSEQDGRKRGGVALKANGRWRGRWRAGYVVARFAEGGKIDRHSKKQMDDKHTVSASTGREETPPFHALECAHLKHRVNHQDQRRSQSFP